MHVSTVVLGVAALLFLTAMHSAETFAAKAKDKKKVGDFTVPACRKYFDSAIWRFDDGPGLWSLSLKPSSCTRTLNGQTSSTGLVIDEVIRLHSADSHWLEGNNAHGVRDQIICHLAQYPNKSEWNVEPGRPDVGYSETVRQECNPERRE